jgi:hypothetical protein
MIGGSHMNLPRVARSWGQEDSMSCLLRVFEAIKILKVGSIWDPRPATWKVPFVMKVYKNFYHSFLKDCNFMWKIIDGLDPLWKAAASQFIHWLLGRILPISA